MPAPKKYPVEVRDRAVRLVADLIADDTDWDAVAELVTESYRLCAPQKLGRRLDR